jgi:monovalent cation:H+ antiporter, CPA1 family
LIFYVFLPPLVSEAALFIGWREFKKDLPVVAVLATVGVLLAAAVTASVCALFRRSRLQVDIQHQHVLFWGGLRGALALALALALPQDLPHHDAIITLTFAVVAFSVFAQGLTITPLLRRLRLLRSVR